MNNNSYIDLVINNIKSNYSGITRIGKAFKTDGEPPYIKVFVTDEKHSNIPKEISGVKVEVKVEMESPKACNNGFLSPVVKFLEIIKNERTNKYVKHNLVDRSHMIKKHPFNHDLRAWSGCARVNSRLSIKNFIYVRTDKTEDKELKEIAERILN
jgi:hypothetical protein